MENEKIIVLVITYNQESYISQTIDSILCQKTTIPMSIVIADDCSNDNTCVICEDYVRKYPNQIKHLYRKYNLGLVKNLFLSLLQYGNVEYVAICAGDDFWIDDYKLQKQYEIFQKNEDVSVVLTAIRKFFESDLTNKDIDNWESPLFCNLGKGGIKHVLFEHFSFFPVGSSIMFRGYDVVDQIKNSSVLLEGANVPGEGMILFSIFALNGRFYFLKDLTTVYRIRNGSVSHIINYVCKTRFDIRYAIQKINIAEYYHLHFFVKLKLAIKLVLLLLYSRKRNTSDVFIEQLNELSKDEKSFYVKLSVGIICVFSRYSKLQSFLIRILRL